MDQSPRALLAVAALLVASAAALPGCSGDGPPPPLLCPRVGIVNGLENLERGPAAGTPGLEYRASLENVDGRCRADGGDLVVEMVIDLVVVPAPGTAGGLVELPYFVTTTGPDGAVAERQDFVARVAVPRNARRAGVTDSFTQRFAGREAGASQYQVLFGFALPEAEALRQYRGG